VTGTAAALLASWEAAASAPAVLRGPAALEPDHDRVYDLPLAEVAALATARLAQWSRDEVDGVLTCAGCGELLDVRVRLSDLREEPRVTPGRYALRSPTARDMAAAAAAPDPRAVLLRRCVAEADGTAIDPADLDAADLAEIDEALESLAGSALPMLTAGCPECGGTASGVVDVPGLLWQYVAAEAGTVLRDVARLAAAYGWSETDVLALSPHRRAAYLALAT
jgi:hypothetical protein